MTEWHPRYRGPGVLIYWHVERKAVCIYSQLSRCTSSEVAAMITGLLRHASEMQVERNYVDTHGQSEIGFAFCSLLGFQLLPRLKNLHAQKLYRPETGHPDDYPNLQPVLTRPIRWELIRQHYDEMVKFATALRLGTAETEETVEHALQADPTTPHVAWEAANFFLLQGSQEKALRQFRMVLANDRESADSALQLCWRATGDANQLLDQVLPRRPDLYLSFLRLLVDKQQTSAAEDVWNHLIALNQSFSPKLVFPYFRFLLEQHKVEAAQRAWQQLASLNPSLQAYLPSRENLIVNGGFEQDVLNGGFDWWYQPGPHATAVLDLTEFHSGRRSLSITFDGQNAADAGVLQFIPVKPNTEYEFSAEYKTKELVSASGPRFAILDAYTNSAYFLGDDLLDTNPWRLQKTAFKTGQDTNLVLLKIIREPAGTLIRGKLWIDGLRLVEK